MKVMTQHRCRSLLALATVALCSACVTDDPASLTKTNMTLQFSTRTETDAYAVEGEAMKSLEVYVVNQASREIVRQWKGNFSETETKTVTFADLTGGQSGKSTTYVVYAIANPPAGYDFESDFNKGVSPSLKAVRTTTTPTVAVDAERGIPMTASKDVTLEDKDVALKLHVVRAVAKAQLTLTNHYGADVTLSSISFGRFFPTKTYLWGDGQTVVMPTTQDWTLQSYTENLQALVLKKDETNKVVPLGYFFESTGLGDAYTFTLNSPTMAEQTFTWNMNQKNGLMQVKRNQLLNVSVEILKPAEVKISYEVTDWDERTVDVPPFQ